MHLLVRVLVDNYGFYDDHAKGETFNMPLYSVNKEVQAGHVEIVCNNLGNNLPYDEDDSDPFSLPVEEVAQPFDFTSPPMLDDLVGDGLPAGKVIDLSSKEVKNVEGVKPGGYRMKGKVTPGM